MRASLLSLLLSLLFACVTQGVVGDVGPSSDPLPVSSESRVKLNRLVNTMTQRWELLDSECSPYAPFAITYLLMTTNARDWILNDLYFDDGNFLADFMVEFAQRYSDAIDAWLAQEDVRSISQPWLQSFQFGASNYSSVTQDLFLGMNAHINYDLAFIVYEMRQGQNRKNDYDRVNDLMGVVLTQVSEQVGGRYDPSMAPGTSNDALSSVLLPMVVGWRDNAWLNGQLLITTLGSSATKALILTEATAAAVPFSVPSLTSTSESRQEFCEANHSAFP